MTLTLKESQILFSIYKACENYRRHGDADPWVYPSQLNYHSNSVRRLIKLGLLKERLCKNLRKNSHQITSKALYLYSPRDHPMTEKILHKWNLNELDTYDREQARGAINDALRLFMREDINGNLFPWTSE